MKQDLPSCVRTATRFAAGLGRGFMDLVFPPSCLLCRAPLEHSGGANLCPPCRRSLPVAAPQMCAGCARVPAAGPLEFCALCRKKYARDGLLCIGPFEGPLRELIHLFKYRADLQAGACLGRLLAVKVAKELRGRCDFVLPVPLHRRRLRSRGFNQAALLARRIASATGWPLQYAALERRIDTEALSGLNGKERRREIAGAIRLRRCIVEGARVLLVDDVVTSGATSEECCRVLKEGGASVTIVATIARVQGVSSDNQN